MIRYLAVILLLVAAAFPVSTTRIAGMARNGTCSQVHVDYGPTTAYGSTVNGSVQANNFWVDVPLVTNALNHYRICSCNSGCSADITVTPTEADHALPATLNWSGAKDAFDGGIFDNIATTLPHVTGGWHSEKVTYTTNVNARTRIVMVDPAGNINWLRGMENLGPSNIQSTPVDYATFMYGDRTCYWSVEGGTQKMKYWAFDYISEYGSSFTFPTTASTACAAKWNDAFGGHSQPVKLPSTVDLIRPNLYSYINSNSGAANSAIDTGYNASGGFNFTKEMWGTVRTTTYNGFKFKSPDFEDPRYKSWTVGSMRSYYSAFVGLYGNFLSLIHGDETDQLGGFGAGNEFSTSANGAPGGGRNHPHLGLMILAVSPFQSSGSPQSGTFQTSGASANTWCGTSNDAKVLYRDRKIYGKWALADFLNARYAGNITNLNNAWGTGGFYTTFFSSGHDDLEPNGAVGDGVTTAWPNLPTAEVPDKGSFQIWIVPVVGNIFGPVLGDDATSNSQGTLYKQLDNPTSCTASTPGSGSINYASRNINITNLTPPPANNYLLYNKYHTGGWNNGGTGILDEDGSHAWYCKADFQNLAGCTAAMKADLDAFVVAYTSDYFSNMKEARDSALPMAIYAGPTYLGTWGTPTRAAVLQGAALTRSGQTSNGNLDVMNVYDMPPKYCSGNDDQARMDHVFSNYGEIGLFPWVGIITTGGAAVNSPNDAVIGLCGVKPNSAAQKSALYTTRIADLADTFHYSNGTRPMIGFRYWDWIDDTANQAWGLIDRQGQSYDAVESVTATSVVCGNGSVLHLGQNRCGGDTGNYGDFVTAVRNANLGSFNTIFGNPQ